jgi:hypothetical protein
MTRKQDRKRWRRQSTARVAGRARAGLRVPGGRPPWRTPAGAGPRRGLVPAVQQRRLCCSACPGGPAPAGLRFWPVPRPARRRRPAHPRQARPLSRASRLPRPSFPGFSPGNGRLTGPEPVRAVPSRRPAGNKPPELSRRPETRHSRCLRRDECRAIPGQPGSLPGPAAWATGNRPGGRKTRAYHRLGAPERRVGCGCEGAQISRFGTRLRQRGQGQEYPHAAAGPACAWRASRARRRGRSCRRSCSAGGCLGAGTRTPVCARRSPPARGRSTSRPGAEVGKLP